MLIQTLLLIGLALVAGYFWQRQKPQPVSKKAGKAANTKPMRPAHRCVVIEPGLTPCKAVHAYEAKHILMDEAPTLPVQGCDVKRCECKFLRYDDRRTGFRRTRMTAANQIMSENNNNKRSKKDRRNS